MAKPGPLNLITDVDGLLVGNAVEEPACTGVTVLVCPGGWTAVADVRGGAPGERDIAALALEGRVGRVDAIVLSGGSVFGLAAADGVTAALSCAGVGLRLHPDSPAIPITPAAVLYDLAGGGDRVRSDQDWSEDPPYRRLGAEALANAARRFDLGAVGAGRGARAGLEPGGLGSASVELEPGLTVGALAAVNPVGSVRMPDGEIFWAWPFEMASEFGGRWPAAPVAAHDPTPLQSRMRRPNPAQPGEATTLAVIAVSAELTAVECKRVAIMAHDGMARAIRPCHTPFDGDIVFVVAKGAATLEASSRFAEIARIGSAAADVLARAIARGVYAAQPSAA